MSDVQRKGQADSWLTCSLLVLAVQLVLGFIVPVSPFLCLVHWFSMPFSMHLSIGVGVDAYNKADLAELSGFNQGRKIPLLLQCGTVSFRAEREN